MRAMLLFTATAAAIVTGCAPAREPPPSPCDAVVGTATSFSRGLASQRALSDLRRQMPDARGDLLGFGLRSLKASRPRIQCRPYTLIGLSTGLTTCAATARLCGR